MNMVLVGDTRILLGGHFHAYLAHVRLFVCFKFIGTELAFCTPVAVLIPLISKGCLRRVKYLLGHHSHSSNS